jgi:GR25 family glycosyltransferase involved in LPS biosynthesis
MEKMYCSPKYDLTRIDAYDGKDLKKYDDIILPLKHSQSNYELACSLSHIKAIITAYLNNEDGIFIMEDDVSNEYSNKWTKKIEDIVLNCPYENDCIIFMCSNQESLKKMFIMKNDFCKWSLSNWCTGCYYINRKGMKKIYDLYYKDNKIDFSIKLINYLADQGALYNNLICYNYTKPTFIFYNIKSTIVEKNNLINNVNNMMINYLLNKNNYKNNSNREKLIRFGLIGKR